MGDDHESALYKAAAGGHAKIVDTLLENQAPAPPNAELRAKVHGWDLCMLAIIF